jgi:hypothetical protein
MQADDNHSEAPAEIFDPRMDWELIPKYAGRYCADEKTLFRIFSTIGVLGGLLPVHEIRRTQGGFCVTSWGCHMRFDIEARGDGRATLSAQPLDDLGESKRVFEGADTLRFWGESAGRHAAP